MTLNRTSGLKPFSDKRRRELADAGIDYPTSTFRPKPSKLAVPSLVRAVKPVAKRSGSNDPDKATVDAVLERDMYYCLLCGGGIGDLRGVDYSIHHRKLRSQGGDNSLPNLVLLCGSGCTGCHGAVHAKPKWAREFGGWILKSTDDPATYPVLVDRADRWVLLTPGGRRVTTPAPGHSEVAA